MLKSEIEKLIKNKIEKNKNVKEINNVLNLANLLIEYFTLILEFEYKAKIKKTSYIPLMLKIIYIFQTDSYFKIIGKPIKINNFITLQNVFYETNFLLANDNNLDAKIFYDFLLNLDEFSYTKSNYEWDDFSKKFHNNHFLKIFHEIQKKPFNNSLNIITSYKDFEFINHKNSLNVSQKIKININLDSLLNFFDFLYSTIKNNVFCEYEIELLYFFINNMEIFLFEDLFICSDINLINLTENQTKTKLSNLIEKIKSNKISCFEFIKEILIQKNPSLKMTISIFNDLETKITNDFLNDVNFKNVFLQVLSNDAFKTLLSQVCFSDFDLENFCMFETSLVQKIKKLITNYIIVKDEIDEEKYYMFKQVEKILDLNYVKQQFYKKDLKRKN